MATLRNFQSEIEAIHAAETAKQRAQAVAERGKETQSRPGGGKPLVKSPVQATFGRNAKETEDNKVQDNVAEVANGDATHDEDEDIQV